MPELLPGIAARSVMAAGGVVSGGGGYELKIRGR